MYAADPYIGCPKDLEELRAKSDQLNAQVVDQINDCQELVVLNKFARDTNESYFKKCLEQRISDIASWQWVLQDLRKRLEAAIDDLKYEQNALSVVVTRIEKEIYEQSQQASKPGLLCPLSDPVEDAIIQEYHFLNDQKNIFKGYTLDIEKQIKFMHKTISKIDADLLNKKEALTVEQCCANLNNSCDSLCTAPCNKSSGKKKKKKGPTVSRWENRCICLKTSGLKALTSAIISHQQARGARAHLSVTAQTYGARVDSAIRRRLHTNNIKLQDLQWQKHEAIQDYKALEEELLSTEKSIVESMDQERVIEVRIAGRSNRPCKELTKDEVDKQLRDELGRVKCFRRQMQKNIDRINALKNEITSTLTRIDSYTEDIIQIIYLDEQRLRARLGEIDGSTIIVNKTSGSTICTNTSFTNNKEYTDASLSVIKEESEDDVND